MPRIAKSEHARIQRLVDEEGAKIAEIATEYGCTPANIYALLSKLRRAMAPVPQVDAEVIPAETRTAPDLFAAAPVPEHAVEQVSAAPATPLRALVPPTPAPPRTPLPAPMPTPMPMPAPATGATAKAARAPKLRQSGFGLCMRAPEGDDSVTPFRSLDDLLSAVKPMLRMAARSEPPVWFSIQPIDLSEISVEAL